MSIRLAAIDLGSNSFRLEIGRIEGNEIICEHYGKEGVRLAFLQRAQDVLGFPIEILPGQEEARLVFEGCAHRLPLSDKKRLVIDIGGGSTELVTGSGLHADRCESFHVGCVNLSLHYFPNGEITREGYEAAKLAAMADPDLWKQSAVLPNLLVWTLTRFLRKDFVKFVMQ